MVYVPNNYDLNSFTYVLYLFHAVFSIFFKKKK